MVETIKKVKVKIGLEIHQQLNTRKLFCRCEGGISEDKPDYVIERIFSLSESEMGEYDIAARMELMKGKKIVYECYHKYDCLIDIDEEPPIGPNKDALLEALKIALALNMNIPDELHVMRKIIIDGSLPSGFQRTILVGRDGYIEVNGKKIGIATLCLEEESGRKIYEDREKIVFRLDRLGIPLIEISTKPDIDNPELAMEVAKYLGLLLRSFNVRRGLGTIRQDINVSIEGGARIELKGVQDLRDIPKIIEYEIIRQHNIVNFISKKLKRIKTSDVVDITDLFTNTSSKLIKSLIEKNYRIFCFKIKNAKGLFSFEIQPKKTFGKEIAEYVATYSYVKGIIHRDELPNYGITSEEVKQIENKLKVSKEDNFIIFVCKDKDKDFIFNLITERLNQYKGGVFPEVRKINKDCTSTYLRPLPTRARMYPETDIPPIRIDKRLIEEAKKEMPVLFWEKYNLLKKYVREKKKIEKIILDGYDDLLLNLLEKYAEYANMIVKYFYDFSKRLNKKLDIRDAIIIMNAFLSRKIEKEAVELIVKEYEISKNINELINKYKKLSEEEVRKRVRDMLIKGFSVRDIMRSLRGRYNMKKLVDIIEDEKRKIKTNI